MSQIARARCYANMYFNAEIALQQALRDTTSAAHRRLHHLPSFAALLCGTLSRDGYKNLLLRLLGLHAPLEAQQHEFRNDPLMVWMRAAPAQQRAARLQRDLAALGVAENVTHHAPRAEKLLPPPTLAGALGSAWVVEGSALGGRIMAKLLFDQFEIGPENGGAYFAQLPDQEARWSACRAAVENYGSQLAARADLLEAAHATMTAFADWMDVELTA